MNSLTLAVAGGRKTQSIVDHCAEAPAGRRILVLTYTLRNQSELTSRLNARRPLAATVDVQGWFSFVLRHWVRPYLPLKYPNRQPAALNFFGEPHERASGERRFFDPEGRIYRRHLTRLAVETSNASAGAVIDRLSRIYHEIHIDEVQDLNGYDLEILAALLRSNAEVHLVGDLRQAILLTNPRDPKYRQYKGLKLKNWFDRQASKGLLAIKHRSTTWRSNQTIATFADSIFPRSWGFEPTKSLSTATCGHDGLFAVTDEHAKAYYTKFEPLCLRHGAGSAKHLDLPFTNFGMAKGAAADHVLIALTAGQLSFLHRGTPLGETPCCSFYVAVTRARYSVAFVCDEPTKLGLPVWKPS